jgi:hypothetical protein
MLNDPCNSSISQKKYYLEGVHFHHLKQFETTFTKKFKLIIHNKEFNLTKEQVYLISPRLYSFLLKTYLPYEIPIPLDDNETKISSDELINAFESIVSLFYISTQIEISQTNVHVYQYIADVLGNNLLDYVCKNVSRDKTKFFKFSSKMFVEGTQEIKYSLLDFDVYINGYKIQCNRNFVSCLSELIFHSLLSDISLNEFKFDNISHPQIFIFLFDIFQGYPFKLENFSMKEVVESFCILGCPFQIENYFADDFNELISLLSFSFSSSIYYTSLF